MGKSCTGMCNLFENFFWRHAEDSGDTSKAMYHRCSQFVSTVNQKNIVNSIVEYIRYLLNISQPSANVKLYLLDGFLNLVAIIPYMFQPLHIRRQHTIPPVPF